MRADAPQLQRGRANPEGLLEWAVAGSRGLLSASVRVALVAAAALAMATHASASPSCTAATHTLRGMTYRTFCGPAFATLHEGGTTYVFKGGSCMTSGSTFEINIGTSTIVSREPKYDYFGISVSGTRPGKYKNQAVAWTRSNGRQGAIYRTTVILARGLNEGTFKGRNFLGGGKGSGTFSCS
jgi:hypothetical protein